jgi:broad specificity phosphatase PhoE
MNRDRIHSGVDKTLDITEKAATQAAKLGSRVFAGLKKITGIVAEEAKKSMESAKVGFEAYKKAHSDDK